MIKHILCYTIEDVYGYINHVPFLIGKQLQIMWNSVIFIFFIVL